jgi:RNA polymerase sigma-70 factor (ECF subfamily)
LGPEDLVDQLLMTSWVTLRLKGAFNRLYARHCDRTYARCLSILHNEADACDAQQATWANVIQTTQWHPRSFVAWVLTVASHRAVDLLRGQARSDHDSLDSAEAIVVPGPASRVEARSTLAVIEDALRGLPAEQREAWLARYQDALSFEEIAKLNGIALGTAKSRVRLAQGRIGAALKETGVAVHEDRVALP